MAKYLIFLILNSGTDTDAIESEIGECSEANEIKDHEEWQISLF